MKNKGFTLAELLGVLALISFLFIVIGPSILNNLSNNKKVVESATDKILFAASDEYIYENSQNYPTGSKHCIKIQDLIDDGKMASPVKNVSGETIDNHSVLVTLYSIGTIDHETMTNSECRVDVSEPMIDFSAEKTSTGSKEVTISYPESGTDYEYKTNNGSWEEATSNMTLSISKPSKISARMKYNNKYITADVNVSVKG